jgi:GLPGLI family protein
MKRLYVLIAIMIFPGILSAQHANFISSGRIVFERKVNTFAAMEILMKEIRSGSADEIYSYLQTYRSNSPQFWTSNFEMYFDAAHTLYQPEDPNMEQSKTFEIPVTYKNKVFNNLESKEISTIKDAFENTYFIKDSIRNIHWKLTDETREIAGYQCRRANALLFDSIYIVAYYADEILSKGGPESFSGLPGMILGLAIPREHVTWFAKSVSIQDNLSEKWKLPEPGKSKKLNTKEFSAEIVRILKQFGFTSSWIQVFMNI